MDGTIVAAMAAIHTADISEAVALAAAVVSVVTAVVRLVLLIKKGGADDR